MIGIGNSSITGLYMGDAEVSAAYLGDTLVYTTGSSVITEIDGLEFRTVGGVSPRYVLGLTTQDVSKFEFVVMNRNVNDGTWPKGDGCILGNTTDDTDNTKMRVYFFKNSGTSTPAYRVRYCGVRTSGTNNALETGLHVVKCVTSNLSVNTLFNTVVTDNALGTQYADTTTTSKPTGVPGSDAIVLGNSDGRNEFDFYGLKFYDSSNNLIHEYVAALDGTTPCIYDKVTSTAIHSSTAVDPDPIL